MDDRYLPVINYLTLGHHRAALTAFERLMREDKVGTYDWVVSVWRDPQRSELAEQLSTMMPRLEL